MKIEGRLPGGVPLMVAGAVFAPAIFFGSWWENLGGWGATSQAAPQPAQCGRIVAAVLGGGGAV